MSSQTPTNHILDVLRVSGAGAAKKAEAMVATASARKAQQAAQTPAFEKHLHVSAETRASVEAYAHRFSRDSSHAQAPDMKLEQTKKTYEKFEAMVLRNFVASMLPKDSEQLFGKGIAGDMWKGMMADQLGDALAKGGGIGIAKQMLAHEPGKHIKPEDIDSIAAKSAAPDQTSNGDAAIISRRKQVP